MRIRAFTLIFALLLTACAGDLPAILDDVYSSIPLTEIYELIESGKTLILDVPDMRSTE